MPVSSNIENESVLLDWKLIQQYLPSEEVVRLKLECSRLNVDLNSPELENFWQPFLEQLHDIDETINMNPQEGKSIKDVFIESFDKVKTKQFAEIEFFRRKNGAVYFKNFPRILELIKTGNQSLNVRDIVAIHTELDDLNIAVIKRFVDHAQSLKATKLCILQCITRFPTWVVDNLGEESFWLNLQELDLAFNNLQILPSNISKLENLQTLIVMYNQLGTLPESIGNLKGLECLSLNGNQITALPDSIVNLSALRELNLAENKITWLPESIDLLGNLKTLDLCCNRLAMLPDSLGNMLKLEELIVRGNNQLTQVPEKIINKFGQYWIGRNQLTPIDLFINKVKIKFNELTPYLEEPDNLFEIMHGSLNDEALEKNQGTIATMEIGELASNVSRRVADAVSWLWNKKSDSRHAVEPIVDAQEDEKDLKRKAEEQDGSSKRLRI